VRVSSAEIVELARQANARGVFRIDQAAHEAGVVEAPPVNVAGGTVTIHEDRFLFLPAELTVPVGTTVV
jgi:hypothetical protein